MLADHGDGLSSSSFLAWSSIAQSVCQRAFSLLAIWCLGSRVQILLSAEEHNLSPFDLNIACLCQSIEINNNKHVCMYVCMYIMYIFCAYRRGALPGDLALATGYVCYWRVYNGKSSSCNTCGFEDAAVLIVTYNDVKRNNMANADVSSIITVIPLIMRRTESKNLNVFRLVLQLSLHNLMRPDVKSKMKM